MSDKEPGVKVTMTDDASGAKVEIQLDLAAAKAFRGRLDTAIAKHEGEGPKRKPFSTAPPLLVPWEGGYGDGHFDRGG